MNKKKIILSILLLVLLAIIFLIGTEHTEATKIIEAGGLLAIGATIFAETGLLIGFFLPGDTLLFAAGFFAAQGRFNIGSTILVICLAAILGNIVGYEIGRRNGKKIFSRDDSVFFHKKYVTKAEEFFESHGGKAILFARFVPIIRTLAPLMAGTARMNYKKFLAYNIIGALVWSIVITLIGYWAGKVIGKYFNIDAYILPIVIIATLFTFGVSFAHALRDEETRKILIKKIKYNYNTLFKN